jgi:hypothetical protein
MKTGNQSWFAFAVNADSHLVAGWRFSSVENARICSIIQANRGLALTRGPMMTWNNGVTFLTWGARVKFVILRISA